MTERVCVIGAGSSGIAAAQMLHERGLDFDCFEAGSQIGGNWRYGNDNQMSSAYKSLHINTSRRMMQYAAYPMDEDLPDYPSHWQVASYFDDYVDHFGFRSRIRFGTEVVKVEPLGLSEGAGVSGVGARGRFAVTVRGRNEYHEPTEPETHVYSQVVVANGHHWDPRWPEPSFPGAQTFPGEAIHAHYYRTPERFAGRRVLVLGIGNSATDIAVEISRVADETYLAMRRGAHIVPKYLFGRPTDHLTGSAVARLPTALQQASLSTLLRLTQGRVTDYGLPRPDHAVLRAHPTVSDDLLTRLGHGDLTVVPNIDRFEGDKVFFVDGTAREVDAVIYCTGYKISFPFLAERVVRRSRNQIDLFRRVVDPRHPGLFFVGLVQPVGAVMPLAEAQAAWVGDLLEGRAALPSYDEMVRQIRVYDQRVRQRYVTSPRHTIQVDFGKYLAELRRERREGRARVVGRGRRAGLGTAVRR